MDIFPILNIFWRGRTREQEALFIGPTNRIFVEKNSLLIQFSGNFIWNMSFLLLKYSCGKAFKKFPVQIKTGNSRSYTTNFQDYFGNNLLRFCAKYFCKTFHLLRLFQAQNPQMPYSQSSARNQSSANSGSAEAFFEKVRHF